MAQLLLRTSHSQEETQTALDIPKQKRIAKCGETLRFTNVSLRTHLQKSLYAYTEHLQFTPEFSIPRGTFF